MVDMFHGTARSATLYTLPARAFIGYSTFEELPWPSTTQA